jgi:hypothetical protein
VEFQGSAERVHEVRDVPEWRLLKYGSCSSLARHLVGVSIPASVCLLGAVLVVAAPS